MNFLSLKIEGLFNRFDYDIPLNKKEHITILTGPNGFGKTMILNILEAIFNRDVDFFWNLKFDRISLETEAGKIVISTVKESESSYTKECSIQYGDFHMNNTQLQRVRTITPEYYLNCSKVEEGKWKFWDTGEVLSFEQIIKKYPDLINGNYYLDIFNYFYPLIIGNYKSHYIKEQKLMTEEKEPNTFIKTIGLVSGELVSEFEKSVQKYYLLSQELDSSFPRRLISENDVLKEEEFWVRFQNVKEKQNRLKKLGLIEADQEAPVFDKESAKVLSVYLKDTESKLASFDAILFRVELFLEILNNRRLTFKYADVNKKFGFRIRTDGSQYLGLEALSSGEQHEIVLLYNLIFQTDEKTLVLIDEPEISLHVAWQKEFLNDLMKIIALQKMQVVIATHSPQIIGEYWDELVYNLEMLEPA